jgi:hypothetical protein
MQSQAVTNVMKECTTSIFSAEVNPESGGYMFLQNVDNYIADYKV